MPPRLQFYRKNAMQKRVIASAICFVLLTFVLLSHALADKSERKYQAAYKSYRSLEASKVKRRYRVNWISCARKFEEVNKIYPKSFRADDALYMAGKIYLHLYGYSSKKSDLDRTIRFYNRLIKEYPKSKMADDAQFRIAWIYEEYRNDKSRAYIEYSKVISNFPKGNVARKAKLRLNKLKKYKPAVTSEKSSRVKRGDPALVTRIRHWSNPDYTRIVVYVEKNVSYYKRLLKSDPSIKKPQRLYVDLSDTRIRPGLDQPIPIHDGLLKMVRAGQHTKNSVRVVLDIESIKSYKVIPLEDPFRIVIDIIGKKSLSRKKGLKHDGTQLPSLSQQLGLSVGKIVIDPGHGGRDPGAIGPSGVKEKDVVLKVSKKLKEIIKKRLDCKVVLTRTDDRFIPLEERTAIANTQKADLFISIHANASPKRNVHGIETFFLNLSSDEEAIRVAARENATSTKKISDLQPILREIMMSSKIDESTRLAGHVQDSLIKKLSAGYSKVNNLGVKQAPFYVLIGAEMPSILVEISFLTNRMEEKRLKSDKYLDSLASSIFTGVKVYIDGMKAAAY